MIPKTLDYGPFFHWLKESPLGDWGDTLSDLIAHQLRPGRWGDMPDWEETLRRLPEIDPLHVNFEQSVQIGDISLMDKGRRLALQATLMGLHPWRKGPYNLFGLQLDTEWRSDWKWNRVLPHISPLADRLILDVGCGNGYHCLRMQGEGAKRVIGIDPSVKFVYQFYAIKHFINQAMNQNKPAAGLPVDVLPVGIEHMPAALKFFDTVFSMGVLYHRRSPIDHLGELQNLLRPGGQVVIETLIINGGAGDVFVPKGRYAKMANVWSLPSEETMLSWMKQCQFKNARMVDVSTTSLQEQRSSDWMQFESLVNFLDPDNPKLTIEGHPAPMRAVFIAEN
jgi:tRNA (mo5U34)-methyltransferase